jgi:hypothetical protein
MNDLYPLGKTLEALEQAVERLVVGAYEAGWRAGIKWVGAYPVSVRDLTAGREMACHHAEAVLGRKVTK